MSETATEQVARLWPEVPARQWVPSLPWALRLPVARDPVPLTKVARIFFEDEGARREIGAVTVPARPRSELAAVLREVAARVARIRTVREQDGRRCPARRGGREGSVCACRVGG